MRVVVSASVPLALTSMAAEAKVLETPALAPEELTEIKRVWAVVDTDGSGSIDSGELRGA